MSVQKNDVLKIAHLARLAVPDSEIEGLARELSNIFDLVAKMSLANTDHIDPNAFSMASKSEQHVRADKVTEPDDQCELLMSNAPSQEAHLFLVPKVVE